MGPGNILQTSQKRMFFLDPGQLISEMSEKLLSIAMARMLVFYFNIKCEFVSLSDQFKQCYLIMFEEESVLFGSHTITERYI